MKNSRIEWTDHTFNPWIGCTKVSPGCKNCYAETLNKRWRNGANWGNGAPRARTSVSNWKQPLKWNIDARRQFDSWKTFRDSLGTSDDKLVANGHEPFCRPRVFCASLADWLDDEVPIEWLADLLKLIHDTPNLDWLLLTKRPQNWFNRITGVLLKQNPASNMAAWVAEWRDDRVGHPPLNVWIGTSVEDQARADERIPELLKIPARVRFLSAEPMLEAMDLLPQLARAGETRIDWCIVGGESGSGARPFRVEWAKDIIQQCRASNVAPFLKQLGSNIVGSEMDKWVTRIKDKKGGNMDEWPAELRVRNFPDVTAEIKEFNL